LTRGISYVEVFDAGNFWIVDDICTDAESRSVRLEGRSSGPCSRRIDLVFLKDDMYNGTDADFEAIASDLIDDRLLAADPVTCNADSFNFYISQTFVGKSNETGSRCGENILPDGFDDFCGFADDVPSFVQKHILIKVAVECLERRPILCKTSFTRVGTQSLDCTTSTMMPQTALHFAPTQITACKYFPHPGCRTD
jgi:hypothetical protein